jgi:hypothetical protein
MVVVQFGWKNYLFIFAETAKYKNFHALCAKKEKQNLIASVAATGKAEKRLL